MKAVRLEEGVRSRGMQSDDQTVRPLEIRCGDPIYSAMNYLLALLLPPMSIILTGRPILGILVFPIWVLALVFSGGLTHPMFILLAWLLIFQSRERSDMRD